MTVLKTAWLTQFENPLEKRNGPSSTSKHIDTEQVPKWLCCYACWRGVLNFNSM